MSERLERIEKYMMGEMSAEEKLLFEKEMRNDAQLQSEVTRMKMIDAALEVSIEEDLRNRLRQLERDQNKEESKSSVLKVRKLYLQLAKAASVLLLISAGVWYFLGSDSSGIEQFSDRHYLDYDYTQMRGNYTNRNDFPFDMSSGNYDKQKMSQWFVTWLKANPADDEARYIFADLLKEMGKNDQAKAELATIIEHNSVQWGEKAEWNYVLLSAVGTWDDLSESIFQKIIKDPAHSYHNQAMQLSELLKK